VTRRPTTRRCAALIAAYALALQAILSAFAAQIARADAPAFEICTRDTDAGRARDPGHALCPALMAGAKPPADRRHRSHAPRAPPLG
jgi:hypothetical protein